MYVGLQKTTLVNFPRHVATAVFLPGCNLRCPYCHNAELALASPTLQENFSSNNTYYNLGFVYKFLEKRRSVISSLVISGGEPFMSPVLFDLIRRAKELSYSIKIDTNGLFPKRLAEVLNSKELKPDMIALDIKTSIERYQELCPTVDNCARNNLKENLLNSLSILKKSSVETEYRTVLVPTLVDTNEIKQIASVLYKDAVWRLAQFEPGNCLNANWNIIKPYTVNKANKLLSIAKTLIPNTEIR